MEPKKPRPLTEEELAAVDRAMAEFANSPRRKKNTAAKAKRKPAKRKSVLRIAPGIRSVLIAAALLILSATVLFLILGSGGKDPSPTAPATTAPTTMSEPPTIVTEPPTEFPIPPDTQPSEPIESTPPQTVPTETSTELPTGPLVVIPEGTPVSDGKLLNLQSLFHPSSIYASVSYFNFTDPRILSLQAIAVADQSLNPHHQVTEEERAYLASVYEGFLWMDICSISRSDAEHIVAQYFGLTLDDFPSAKNATYWDQTDRYYFIAEANAHKLNITHAIILPNGNLWVRYENVLFGLWGEMTLESANHLRILSNKFIIN